MSNVAVLVGGYYSTSFANITFLNTNISTVDSANTANITFSGVLVDNIAAPTFSNVTFLNTNISTVDSANTANITFSGVLVDNIAAPVFLNTVSAATTTIRTGASEDSIDGAGTINGTAPTQSWYYS